MTTTAFDHRSLAALLIACGCDPPRAEPPPAPAATAEPTARAHEGPPPAAAIDPDPTWTEIMRARVPATSGLGIGSPMLPLAVATGEGTCNACTASGVPRLVIVADLASPESRAPLQDLDAIAQLYADDGLVAVALMVPFDGGRARVVTDNEDVLVRASTLRRQARLAMPLTTPAADATGKTRWFDEYVAVTSSPTVMLVGPDDRVVYVGAARRHWGDLDRAIVALVAPPHAASDATVAKGKRSRTAGSSSHGRANRRRAPRSGDGTAP